LVRYQVRPEWSLVMGIVALLALGVLVGVVATNAPPDRPAAPATQDQRPLR
jgi:hypothetical protein